MTGKRKKSNKTPVPRSTGALYRGCVSVSGPGPLLWHLESNPFSSRNHRTSVLRAWPLKKPCPRILLKEGNTPWGLWIFSLFPLLILTEFFACPCHISSDSQPWSGSYSWMSCLAKWWALHWLVQVLENSLNSLNKTYLLNTCSELDTAGRGK